MSRPTDYSPDLAARLCGLIAQGTSLRKACRRAGMPELGTVLLWLQQQPAFAQQYQHARDIQADSLADEIVDIADSAEGLDSAGVSAAKLRVDARKWAATKRLARPADEGSAQPTPALTPDELHDLTHRLADEI